MGVQPPTPPIEVDKFFRRQSVLPLARAQRQRFDRISNTKQPKILDVLYVAGIRTLDPLWAWQTRDALDLTSKIFQWVGWAAASPLTIFFNVTLYFL